MKEETVRIDKETKHYMRLWDDEYDGPMRSRKGLTLVYHLEADTVTLSIDGGVDTLQVDTEHFNLLAAAMLKLTEEKDDGNK